MPKIAKKSTARSTTVCARSAESTASGTASKISRTTPPTRTEIVGGSDARSTESIEKPAHEPPKLPWRKIRQTKSPYCTGSGLSTPSRWFTAAI